MQQLLQQKKNFFLSKNISTMYVPAWPELALKFIWLEAYKVDEFNSFIPDEWTLTNKKADRPFFYGILCTLKPDYVQQVILDCRQQRDQQRKPPPCLQIKNIPQGMIDMLLE
jgi:hypothetical protein